MRKNTTMLLISAALAAFTLASPQANANDWGGFAGGLAGGIIAGAIAAQMQPHVIIYRYYVPHHRYYVPQHRMVYAAPRHPHNVSVAHQAPSSGPSGDDLRQILGN